ncbi:hypothetical protein FTW19_20530 [Terriglobus albidus]|uniref:Uncharacterized protein n=1 Tax=Terriglobus albidus TaxID=1592106 RepID=A0A5B9EG82_9BACT|nr:hypothetical protein [Terriglobus albidus]QEE30155.1 hypothetical protein FTW19_20530 [Terriglobus albidus]
MDLSAGGSGRMTIALVVLLGLAAAAWGTMEPGKYRSLTMILLGFFAVRILLGRMKYRQDVKKLM